MIVIIMITIMIVVIITIIIIIIMIIIIIVILCQCFLLSGYFLSGAFVVVQPVHLHQHTRAARARKSANTVSANVVSMALILGCRQCRMAGQLDGCTATPCGGEV